VPEAHWVWPGLHTGAASPPLDEPSLVVASKLASLPSAPPEDPSEAPSEDATSTSAPPEDPSDASDPLEEPELDEPEPDELDPDEPELVVLEPPPSVPPPSIDASPFPVVLVELPHPMASAIETNRTLRRSLTGPLLERTAAAPSSANLIVIAPQLSS
jgi:hypothetical protein